MLEIHVDTPDGDHVRSARVELTYNGESNLANTDEMLNDTTVTDYFDRRNGQTVDIQLIDQ